MKRRSILFLAGIFLLITGVQAQVPTKQPSKATQTTRVKTNKPAPADARPKLVVVIVVDQMRADYIEKFGKSWSGGLKRLAEQGAWFKEAAYPYAATETCVGHATISTGAIPATHGIIANAWWDRETQKMIACTADPSAKNSGYAGTK